MKFLLTSDWHIGAKCSTRKDNLTETQYKKIKWILELAKKEQVEAIVHAGDFFDRPTVGLDILRMYCELLKEYKRYYDIWAVYGQHDLPYHSLKLKNHSALTLLETIGLVKILKRQANEWGVVGCSFNEVIPEKEGILVIHKLILKERKEVYQDQFMTAKELLKLYDYDIIISGDNHEFFIEEYEGKILFNCGSIVRLRKCEAVRKPKVVIYHLIKDVYRVYDIPINLDCFVDDSDFNVKIDNFISQIRFSCPEEISVKKYLTEILSSDKICQKTKDLLLDIWNSVCFN